MKYEKAHHPHSELTPELSQAFQTAFISRADCYPLQLDNGSYVSIRKSLTTEMVTAHLKGTITIGAYTLNKDSNAKWLCLDADTDEEFHSLIQLNQQLDRDEITSYLELSRRGGHLWLFTPTLSGTNTRRFGKQLFREYNLPNRIELYPKQDQLVSGPGSLVRLPLGIHRKSNKRYHFVTSDGAPLAPTIRKQIAILSQPEKIPKVYIAYLLEQAPEDQPPSPTPVFGKQLVRQEETLSETLKATISVYDFVSRFVTLDKQGKGYCPFHDDQHRSFQVNPNGNYWNCYADCGGGSIIDFWMKWRETHGQDGSFVESIKNLREMLL